MLADHRQDVIREELSRAGEVRAADLATRFGVSEDTIRRDLRGLAATGACRRVYGGAVASAAAPAAGPIAARRGHAAAEKARLGAAAARLLRAGETLFIDAGTTNEAVARAIRRDLPLTIATNAPGVVAALAGHPLVDLVVLGGPLDRDLGACLGAEVLRAVARLHADRVILGSCGLDARQGATAFASAEAEAKRAMVRAAGAVLVVATRDKVGTAAPFRVAAPGTIETLVVEADAAPGPLAAFRALGTALVHP